MFLVKNKPDHFAANVGANSIEHTSVVELYIILATLEMFLWWNRTVLITEYQQVKWDRCIVILNIWYKVGFSETNKYFLAIYIQAHGHIMTTGTQ